MTEAMMVVCMVAAVVGLIAVIVWPLDEGLR